MFLKGSWEPAARSLPQQHSFEKKPTESMPRVVGREIVICIFETEQPMQLVMKHITHMLRFVVASRKLNVVAGIGFCGFAVEKASTLAHRWHHSSWKTTFFFTPISTSFVHLTRDT